eukprot:scaffold3602_cov407-Prasinococcus_capsulatus_cf.AAC.5
MAHATSASRSKATLRHAVLCADFREHTSSGKYCFGTSKHPKKLMEGRGNLCVVSTMQKRTRSRRPPCEKMRVPICRDALCRGMGSSPTYCTAAITAKAAANSAANPAKMATSTAHP